MFFNTANVAANTIHAKIFAINVAKGNELN
jgi:hypothetical protein